MDAEISTWTLVAALNRWLLYTFMLIATGSGLFTLLIPVPPGVREAATRFGKIAALFAAVCYLAAIGLGGAEMVTGDVTVLAAPDTWTLAASTTLGWSAALGVPAMLVLYCGYAARSGALVVLGVVGGIGSFLLTGHAATATPAWLARSAIAIHLAGAAYWIGALYPLTRTLRDCKAPDAAGVIAAFSRYAVGFVGAIIISGVIISWIQLGSASALWETAYGLRLSAKIALFGFVFALAGVNKLVLSPRLLAGASLASRYLRSVIVLEYALIIFILGAAVSLTLTEPPRKPMTTAPSGPPSTE